jgi:hypothetical protein
MFKKLVPLFFCVITIAQVFAMETKKVANWPDWVEQADTIQVTSALGKQTFDLPIQKGSIILDIKNQLYNHEGIPVEQQSLVPAKKGWMLSNSQPLTKTPLDDTSIVKDVMAKHNTALLMIYLKLRNPQQKKEN